MIDTHCHLYLDEFDEDIEQVLERAVNNGVTGILLPAIDETSLKAMEKLEHPKIRFYKMAGLHPCELTGQRCNLEASLLTDVARKDIVAVGETGLDYYWSREHIEAQKRSFHLHCKVAKTLNKPVVIHNRESTNDMLNIIKEEQDGRLTGVWHCFNGTIDEGERAIDLGFKLGIGGVVTFKNGGVDKTVKHLPLEEMMLETDAPFLAPTPYRGKRNEPSFVALVAQKLADVFDLDLTEIDRITTTTARTLFNIWPTHIDKMTK